MLFSACTWFGFTFHRSHSALQELTTIAFHLALFSMVGLVVHVALCVFHVRKELRMKIILSVAATILVVALVELGLRASGIMLTRTEQIAYGQYSSTRKSEHLANTWLWRHKPSIRFTVIRPEFTHDRSINSMGLSDKEHGPKSDNSYRIIGVGDSFTEGYGTDASSTWLKVMENQLNERTLTERFETVNGGVGGSDLVYAYMLVKQELLKLEPDMVILSINTSDLYDIGFRGGFERFRPDGSVGEPAPWWEWIYMYSHVMRLVVHRLLHYSDHLIPDRTHLYNRKRFVSIAEQTFAKFSELAQQHGFEFVVAVHPNITDFDMEGYGASEFDSMIALLDSLSLTYIDVKRCFEEQGVRSRKRAEQYFWPIDTHYNTEGYRIYGMCMADGVAQLLGLTDQKYLPPAEDARQHANGTRPGASPPDSPSR